MNTRIEIRENRGRAIFMGIYILIVLVALNVFAYMTANIEENPFFMTLVVVLNLVMAYNLYRLTVRLIENKPVLTLTSEALTTTYRGVTTVHPWSNIKELSVDTKSRYRHVLVDSGNGPVKTDISGLEKQPEEIERVIGEFRSGGKK